MTPDAISFNAGRRAVAKLCLNNIWGKFAQTPDRTRNEFNTEPRRFNHLFSDNGFDVYDVQHVNYDCLYVSYIYKSIEFQAPSLNTIVTNASYVTTRARLQLYSYLVQQNDRALYCDTESVIYKHIVG